MTERSSDDRLIDEIIYLASNCDGITMDRFDAIADAIPKAKDKVKDQIAFKERECLFFEKIRLLIEQFYKAENTDLYTLRIRSTDKGLEFDPQYKPRR